MASSDHIPPSAELTSQRIRAACRPLIGLADEIEATGLPAEAVDHLIAELRRVERFTAAVTSAVAECVHRRFEQGQGPPPEEALSSGVPAGQAHAEASRVGVFRAFPLLAGVWRSGAITPANVDVLARLIADMTPAEIAALAGADAELAERAQALSPESFGRAVRRQRDAVRKDNGDDAARRAKKAAQVRVGPNRDRTGYYLNAQLDPIDGAAFLDAYQKSVRRIEREAGDNHGLSASEISVRALVETFVRGANTASTAENSKPVVVVNVLTDGQTLSEGPRAGSVMETFDGQPLSPKQLSRLCCDATLRRIDRLADGSVNVSHTGRTANAAQRSALRAMYPVCPISGAPWSHLEIHHVDYYSKCKETALDNLLPLSKRWHHLVHDMGWRLVLDPDRTLHVFQPDRTLWRTIPAPDHANLGKPATDLPAAA